ncbi:MAG: prephenate dehydratase domain-containing protein [Acidimicrobiia bacterium]
MPIGYQGEAFSYSHTAAGELFGDRERIGFSTFPAAFDALVEGAVSRLVLPVENSTTGSVLPVLDNLVGGTSHIVGEHYLRVRHAVLGVPGATLADVTEIHSHPQALSQCVAWIVHHGWEPIPVHDTAGAVRLVAERGDPAIAALAPPWAADAHGLEVLATDVMDRAHNTTRFIVLERGPAAVGDDADKTSIAFETAHRPGALALVLTELGLRGANMTRIESRPTDEAWTYRFFVDLTHPPGPAGWASVFDPLPATMSALHHLGSYPAAVRPE